ncbi:MAG: OmpP1/FadL family transporter [Gammaproteobacteria bacterium]
MAKRFNLRRLFLLMSMTGFAAGMSGNALASAFQIWEMDAASIGNYHAGTAAIADDASTAMYNPAGMLRIKNQQLIIGADPIITNFQYKGTVQVSTLLVPGPSGAFVPAPPQSVTAQGGGFNFVPFGHYVAPISKRFAFGMSIDVPFGLKTDYGSSTAARYAATLTRLQVIDYTPSLGIGITDKFSVGVGLDIQKLSAEFNQFTTVGIEGFILPQDTKSHNEASDTGYGWRVGALYQFTDCTRLGINYRSKVTHHAKGNSYFIGPLATDGISQESTNLKANATLPAVTSFSLFHSVSKCWDIMGTVAFNQWSVFKNLILQNVAGINAANEHVSDLVVTVPEHYHNAWNVAFGANYHPNEKWIIRTGVGYDESPTNNNYRNLQLPDSDRIALAFGAHFQATKQVSFDAGYTHIFAMNTRINNLSQPFGPEIVTTNGSTKASADVYGLQLRWDIV